MNNLTDPTPNANNTVSNVVNNFFSNQGKTLEKMALYVIGTLVATGVIPDSPNSKNWLIAGIAAVLTGLHISTPKQYQVRPQTVIVPPLAGIGNQIAIQLPIQRASSVTIVNLDDTYGLILCNDTRFDPTTTWPLNQNNALPIAEVHELWVQNPNDASVKLLILQGLVPISLYNPKGSP